MNPTGKCYCPGGVVVCPFMKEETTMNKQNTGCDMKTITTELCDTEMNALKALRTNYQTKTDVFLKERGFGEAIGKFTHFRLNNGNVEVHVDDLGSSGCEACSQDEEFVNEMEELYVNIRNVTTSIEQKALRSFEANLKRKLAF